MAAVKILHRQRGAAQHKGRHRRQAGGDGFGQGRGRGLARWKQNASQHLRAWSRDRRDIRLIKAGLRKCGLRFYGRLGRESW